MKKRIITLITAISMLACTACGKEKASETAAPAEKQVYKVGICNYVDDASLVQIYENIGSRLEALGNEQNAAYEIVYDNCNADEAALDQIIERFISEEKVDLMVGIATPVAMAMKEATEENGIPVIFSAVSDPLATGIVADLDAPGANITGTSDYLNTTAILSLIFAADPDIDSVGLLYDTEQDSSTSAIADAKSFLDAKGVSYVERTGATVDEVLFAADALANDDKVDAVFTPTDNTIMTAELSIYQTFADAGIPHYCGADSFALNGAFVGFGVDYANIGTETADMISEVLYGGADIKTLPVRTFNNGIATINTETCAAVGYDIESVKEAFWPFCTKINEITTAEDF